MQTPVVARASSRLTQMLLVASLCRMGSRFPSRIYRALALNGANIMYIAHCLKHRNHLDTNFSTKRTSANFQFNRERQEDGPLQVREYSDPWRWKGLV